MLIQALKIVLTNSKHNLQSLEQEYETKIFAGQVKFILDRNIEETKQAHALLEDYIKRMEKKDE